MDYSKLSKEELIKILLKSEKKIKKTIRKLMN